MGLFVDLLVSFLFFLDKVSLCSIDSPETSSVAQAALSPEGWIKSVCHHHPTAVHVYME